MASPEISVIVPARDAAGTLPALLAALDAQSGAPPHEVIVVDDGSRDATVRVARHRARVIAARGGGPAAARNLGAAQARGRLLAFTDADCRPAPGWLAAGALACSRAQLVQGPVVPDPAARAGPFDRSLWVNRESGLYETANLFVERAWFVGVGGFVSWLRPEQGIELGEDTLLAWRLRRAGARTAFAPEALVIHAVHRRRLGAYVAERRRLAWFPALVDEIPELRRTLLWHRWFLSRRSAAFDLAAGGVIASLAQRRPGPLLATIPYALTVGGSVRGWGPRVGPSAAIGGILADAVGAGALLAGSWRARCPVI